jgi:hypothetical protein
MILILSVPLVREPRSYRQEGLLLDFDWWVLIDINCVFQATQAHFRHPIIIVVLPLIKALRFHHRASDGLADFGRSELSKGWLLHLGVPHAHQQGRLLLVLLVHDLKLAIIWLKLRVDTEVLILQEPQLDLVNAVFCLPQDHSLIRVA